MKRAICPQHIHYVRNGKSALLSSENCSICKRASKIGPLRTAELFKNLVFELEFSVENPYYDQFGFNIQSAAEKALKAYFKLIHPAYAKPLLESLKIKENLNETN